MTTTADCLTITAPASGWDLFGSDFFKVHVRSRLKVSTRFDQDRMIMASGSCEVFLVHSGQFVGQISYDRMYLERNIRTVVIIGALWVYNYKG